MNEILGSDVVRRVKTTAVARFKVDGLLEHVNSGAIGGRAAQEQAMLSGREDASSRALALQRAAGKRVGVAFVKAISPAIAEGFRVAPAWPGIGQTRRRHA